MSIEKRALSGTVIGAFSFAVSMLQTIAFVPVLLGAWGAETYGAWLALQALAALITTLDLGHHAYVGNEVAKEYFGERPALRVTLASGVWTAVAIGGVEVLVVVGLWAVGLLPRAVGLSPALVSKERIGLALLVWMAFWIPNGSVVGIVGRLLPPAGKFVRFSAWGLAARVVMTISVLGAVFAGLGVLGTTVVWQVAMLAYSFALFVDLRRQFADLWPFHGDFRRAIGQRNFGRSLVLTGGTMLTQLQQNGLNLLVTGILGVVALPVFSTARTVASTFLQAANILCAPLAPEMVRFHVNREHDKLHATFAANWLVGGSGIEFGMLLSLPLLAPLYALWTRHALPFDRPLFAFLALSIALRTLGSPLQTYLSAVNHLRAVTTSNAVQSAVVIAIAAAGLHRFGLLAAGVAVLAGEVVGSCVLPLFFVLSELPQALRPRLLASAALATAPALVTAGVLAFYARRGPSVALSLTGALATLAFAWVQWRRLPHEVRVRIVSVVRPGAVAPQRGS